ncbi:hypothetical protein BN174_2080004 [Clostridioides difficile E15]|nr:hypothetical protein BN174_2080004 [Clostridioides difficile E15]
MIGAVDVEIPDTDLFSGDVCFRRYGA